MRFTLSRRALLLGATLIGPASLAAADDPLFLPSYQRMGLVPTAPTPGPAAAPAPAPATLGRPVAIGQLSPAGRPRLGVWPHEGRAVAPAGPAASVPPARTRPSRKGSTAAPAVAEPFASSAPGTSVAAALSVRADNDRIPSASASASWGVLARLRKAEPAVPPGLPHGAQPREMVPPEPLDHGPELANRSTPPARRLADPARDASLPAIEMHPASDEPSSSAPVRVGDLDRRASPMSEPGPAARPRPRAIPPMIARPTEPEADSPLRRVRASDADLESTATAPAY